MQVYSEIVVGSSTYTHSRPERCNLQSEQPLSLCIFITFLSFYYFLSPFLSIILLFMSINLPMSIYLPTYLPTSTHLPIYINTPTHLYQHPYLSISTHLPTYLCLLANTYQPMSTYHHLPTNLYQSLNINIELSQTQEPVSVLFNFPMIPICISKQCLKNFVKYLTFIFKMLTINKFRSQSHITK